MQMCYKFDFQSPVCFSCTWGWEWEDGCGWEGALEIPESIQAHLEQGTQHHGQVGLGYFQRGGLHKLPEQLFCCSLSLKVKAEVCLTVLITLMVLLRNHSSYLINIIIIYKGDGVMESDTSPRHWNMVDWGFWNAHNNCEMFIVFICISKIHQWIKTRKILKKTQLNYPVVICSCFLLSIWDAWIHFVSKFVLTSTPIYYY